MGFLNTGIPINRMMGSPLTKSKYSIYNVSIFVTVLKELHNYYFTL